MALLGRHTFQIRPQDCDFTEKVAMPVLGDYVLQTAGKNADENGFGMNDLHRSGRTWVLSRMAIEMKRMPRLNETVTVETWIESIIRIVTTRNFSIMDNAGEIIGGACSNWAMIDIGSRRSVDLQAINSFGDYATGIPSIIEKPEKVTVPEGKAVEARRVRYSDIDVNCHTNSMKYVEWMLDRFPLEWYRTHCIKRLDINFVHEALYGEEVTVFQQEQDAVSLFEIKKTSGETACKMKIQW